MAHATAYQQHKDVKEMAMEHVQEVDSVHLSEEELAGIIEVFEQDSESAKAYLMIKIENIQKAWIR
jgi:sugar/nucleoside kinase (ribokinase family)